MEQESSLQAYGLGASYGARVILAEVDFALPKTGVTALLGPAGTGKSTLLRTMAGLNAGNPRFRRWGALHYAGQPVDRHPGSVHPAQALPRLVQQQASLMRSSTLEALIEQMRLHRQHSPLQWRQWVQARLQEYGFAELLPMLDTPTLELTAMQQRAVAILREAWAEPAVLMLDEPTAELAGYEAFVLLELIARVAQRSCVLLVTHQQKHAQAVAQHMLLLAGGRIQESGPMDGFMHAPATAAGRQFLRSGSCSVPMPGTPAEHLADDVQPAPPLPAAALQAIAEFADLQAVAMKLHQKSELEAQDFIELQAKRIIETTAASVQAQGRAAFALAQHGLAAFKARPVSTAVLMDMLPLTAAEHSVPASRGPSGFAWLVPGRLAGTPWPGVVHDMELDLQALRRCGVTMLITLTEKDFPQQPLQRHGLKNFHLPVYDHESPTVAQIQMLLARMSAAMRRGEVLAVHCLAGLGRTGTVLAAWLVREGLTGEEALRRVRLIDAQYVQSQAQEALLHAYENALLEKMA
ncbi:ATP-binding cassette domain-containing protein [Comamonas sp.]|uniref:phosphatase domain-containing protein n=1 Tax=Comamonas sp. TaxID=34028 RepID=UPI003A916B06